MISALIENVVISWLGYYVLCLLGAIAGILKLAVKMNVLSTQMARIHFFNKPGQCAEIWFFTMER